MKPAQERRSPHVRRVPLVALVDICQAAGDGSPFQAHSANVSGRGMQVRTGYLPELGDELVCRFEHDGQEILVEGRVAWRSECDNGGEFGLQFTALDAESADILRELGPPAQQTSARADEAGEESDLRAHRLELTQGQRVRLHMEGLGAPMKASVHSGGDRRIRVGSGLEFLKVGRSLEVEELEGGERQSARVDSVNVIINPQTSVPELVVQLRYEGISDTPPPAKVEGEAAAAGEPEEPEEGEESAGPWESVDVLSERLSGLMDRVSSVAQAAGGRMGLALAAMTQQAAGAAARRSTRPKTPAPGASGVESPRARRRSQRTQRATGRAPSHLRSGIHDLNMTGQARPMSRRPGPLAEPAVKARSPRGRLALVLGVISLSLGSAAALRAFGGDESGPEASAAPEKSAADAGTSAPAEATPGAAVQAASPATVPKKKPEATPEGIVADVPLFGERSVTGAESPPGDAEEVDVERAEKLAAAAAVPDETWDDVKLSAEQPEQAAAEPWGRGRLHLPTIHRIRLDGEGGKLSGAVEPNGFVIVVPGRKAMESGRAIQKRDKRIAAVTASNTDEGTKLRFQFRGPVPPYRVRLRKDFVEFLISAPEDGVAAL